MSRRKHQCSFDGCDSEEEFEVRLTVHLEKTGTRLDCPSSLRMCARHREKAAELILSVENRANFMKVLADQNLPPPDWRSARVEFIPLPKEPLVISNVPAKSIIQCDLGDNKAQCVMPAKYQIAFRVPRIASNGKAFVDLVVSTVCCEKHRKLLKPEMLLTKEHRSALLGALMRQGFALPDFNKTTLRFHELKKES